MTVYAVRRTAGELLITAGCFLLLFASWQLWWTDVESNAKASESVENFLGLIEDPKTPPPPLDPNGIPVTIGKDGVFAVMYVPRFGKEWRRPIVQGTKWYPLTRGIGHYEKTVGPGKVGNFSLAGHRTTYGRPFHNIDRLQDGDRLIIETATTYFVYEVTSHDIVAPTAVEVVAPVPDQPGRTPTTPMITLTSCHPKFSAAQRYVVHGTLVTTAPRKGGLDGAYWAVPEGAVS
ncbi:MAG: class E sortase [Tetrasphaera sp.]|nr:class E sortase [Tetrasphaera sp.]